ncbi:MAG: undecaprenyldiphospho-muramoylpentapeptide beta-N-acetylglucosaminyltransferase [Xanthomonadaceae bacterium]|nr:undecaprenyldiphospho-muramoylpentapeptide beta-N-acetylglucosaminyltransferase [Xanthomonadaceae bacterium]
MHLATALWQALAAMRRRRPAAVLGMGGYVSGPGGIAARLLGRPLLIHEQNSVAGLTNRVLARAALRVLTGFPGVLERGEWIGNPVRAAIAELPTPSARMLGRTGPLRVLVLGGSQGASALNAAVPRAVAALQGGERPEVRHQCGPRHLVDARAAWASVGIELEPLPFIDDMAEAYAWADLVVCRAGALTVAELAAAGVASVLVPFPAAVDDHQTSNARFLSDAGAAELLPQHELNSDRLAQRLRAYANDRGRLLEMAEAARALARPHATADLAGACVHAAEGRA